MHRLGGIDPQQAHGDGQAFDPGSEGVPIDYAGHLRPNSVLQKAWAKQGLPASAFHPFDGIYFIPHGIDQNQAVRLVH